MLFNSYPFIFIFLPIVLIGFYALSSFKQFDLAKAWLLLCSLGFYSYWDIHYLPLLVGSILFNYTIGEAIMHFQRVKNKKRLLFFGISINLLVLAYFKYANFFLSSLFWNNEIVLQIALPLGISFFTFTQVAYLVDIFLLDAKRGAIIDYALFVTIFPHLIAGPILHHKNMINQFRDPKMFVPNRQSFAEGILFFVLGLFKKVMVADYLASFVGPIFDASPIPFSLIPAWFGAACYSLQLYFDFSGYSDMAIGLGLLINVRLPLNFNSPYQADSIIDFWRRWHISLSTFLRDYLYIPLGGNRGGEVRKLSNLVITMVLGGLWHGAGWTFVLWGTCHGFFLMVNHLWRKLGFALTKGLSKTLTLIAVMTSWVIFRSPTLEKAISLLKAMIGYNGLCLPMRFAESLSFLKNYGVAFSNIEVHFFSGLLVIALGVVAIKAPNTQIWKEKFLNKPILGGLVSSCASLIVVLYLDQISEFLYYQF
ncbi:MAG: MBOAT family O-acyltransferase [Parachlamydiaceae bacterium]